MKWFTKAAEQGYFKAEFYLGKMYYNGLGVAQDYIEAGKWFKKAAIQGHAEAQFYLGVPSEFGQNSTLSRWQKPQRSWVGPKKVRRIRKLRKISYNFPTDAKLKLSKNPCSA